MTKTLIIQLNGKHIADFTCDEFPTVKMVEVPIGDSSKLINIRTAESLETYGVLRKSDGTQRFFKSGKEIALDKLVAGESFDAPDIQPA